MGIAPAVTEVVRQPVGRLAEGNDLPGRSLALRRSVHPRKLPEILIERAVFLQDDHDVLDGCCLGPGEGWAEQRSERGPKSYESRLTDVEPADTVKASQEYLPSQNLVRGIGPRRQA